MKVKEEEADAGEVMDKLMIAVNEYRNANPHLFIEANASSGSTGVADSSSLDWGKSKAKRVS